MISKWIKETLEASLDGGDYLLSREDKIQSILERIDKLLRRAMNSTDDENLSDAIRKEIKDES